MSSEIRRGKLFGRRTLVLGAFKGMLSLALIGRLYYLQILKSKEYTTLSDSNRIKLLLLPPRRGNILDRRGDLLATTRNYYRVLLNPERVNDTKHTVNKLADVLHVEDWVRKDMLSKIAAHQSRRPLTVYEHLSWKDVARVEVNTPSLPGISIEAGQARYYPLGPLAAHALGYLGPVTEEEIKRNPLLNHPDFKIGKTGVEAVEENILRGEAGVQRMEVNAFGLSVRELSREESKPGDDIRLTIDREVQEFAGKRLEKHGGTVVVIDVTNGDIITLLSAPGFDPAAFTYGISPKYWKELMEDPDVPLLNKAIATQYPPGSTFKIVVALAALAKGINPESSVYCPGYVMLGNRRFHCWKKEGHGHMTLLQAISHSCNSYFYTIARKIGPEIIAETSRKMGLGSPLGIVLPGEKPGLVPDPDWKKKNVKEVWQQGDTLNFGIGQGFTLVTPLQQAVMMARLASGKAVKPRLILSETGEKKEPVAFPPLDIPEEDLNLVRKGVFSVVNVPGGTAFRSRIEEKGMTMAGKTGTAQVVSRKHVQQFGDDMTEEEKFRSQHHALFIGYAPYEAPRYAVSVVVEHGQSGSGAAAPVARDILEFTQQRYLKKKGTQS